MKPPRNISRGGGCLGCLGSPGGMVRGPLKRVRRLMGTRAISADSARGDSSDVSRQPLTPPGGSGYEYGTRVWTVGAPCTSDD